MLLLLLEAPLDVPHMPVNCNSSFQGAVNFIWDAAINLLGVTDFVFYNTPRVHKAHFADLKTSAL